MQKVVKDYRDEIEKKVLPYAFKNTGLEISASDTPEMKAFKENRMLLYKGTGYERANNLSSAFESFAYNESSVRNELETITTRVVAAQLKEVQAKRAGDKAGADKHHREAQDEMVPMFQLFGQANKEFKELYIAPDMALIGKLSSQLSEPIKEASERVEVVSNGSQPGAMKPRKKTCRPQTPSGTTWSRAPVRKTSFERTRDTPAIGVEKCQLIHQPPPVRFLRKNSTRALVTQYRKGTRSTRGSVGKTEKVDVNARDYHFSLKVQRNQGYGSLTAAQEGGLLPRPGAPVRRKVRVDYRDHFISGEITGRIKDAPTKTALLNMSKDAMSDAEESFTTFQDFYLFGNGSGSLGVVTTGYAGGTPTLLTFLLAQATPYGSMMLQPNQRVQFFQPVSPWAQRTTGGVTVSTVVSKDTATDVVTFDALPTNVVANDIVTIEDTLNRETLGLDFYVGNSGTEWLKDSETGTPIVRAGAPWANANVIDKSGAALAPDFIDTIALQTSNQIGDGKPLWDQVMVSHPVQQNMYRKLGYALTRTVNASGNSKLDLGFAEVSHNGMQWRVSSHCQADRIYGLVLSCWRMPEIKAPQMYDFSGGPLIQKPGTDRYYDAQQFAVYARYNLVCTEPYTQWLLKNLSFTVADVRRNLL